MIVSSLSDVPTAMPRSIKADIAGRIRIIGSIGGAIGHCCTYGRTGKLKLLIDLPLTPSQNELLRMHWGKKARIQKDLVKRIWATPGRAQWMSAHEGEVRCRVEIVRQTTGSKEPDPDNLVASAKLIMDALVENDLLIDDDPFHVDLEVTWKRVKTKKEQGTSVSIEPI